MESQSAFVRSNSAVELASVSTVYMRNTVVICPGNTESKHSVWLNHSFQKSCFLVFRMFVDYYFQRFENFLNGLYKLWLICVALFYSVKNSLNLSIHFKNTCLNMHLQYAFVILL